jgi:hypothetical protein
MDTNKPSAHGHGVAAEPDRVPVRLVTVFGVVLTATAIVAAVLMIALFKGLDRSAETKDEQAIATAGLEVREAGVPPLPRLQVQPVRHWKDFAAAERERLSTYGWMDRSTGAVHIPIDRAMDLIAERGVGPLPQAPMVVPGPAAAPGAVAPAPAAAGVKK